MEESVGRKSGDESCGSGLEVRVGYLGNGDLTFGGCHYEHVSTYSLIEDRELELPLGGEFGFFVSGHE